ncbi:MAG: hypothetical protein K9H26_19485 [Prolixibacteraceae bacterium]|nr:hypothetical protein [Prolixibacteraceae bacterium]
MRQLEIEQLENIEGGSNGSAIACGVSTTVWALGALTSMTGFGLALWVVGAGLVAYCNAQTAGVLK